MKASRSRILALLVFGLVLMTAMVGQAAETADLRILPIDNAKFLVGAKFDLQVELLGVHSAADIEVLVNGVPAEEFFDTVATLTQTSNDRTEWTARDVFFRNAGVKKVDVTATFDGQTLTKSVYWEVVRANATDRPAKNVILFLADGMSQGHITAARIISRGMTEGKYNDFLAIDTMDVYGTVSTSGMDSIITDSANSASAYATGHKSVVNALGVYPNNTPDPMDDPRVENLIELLKRSRHMATGIVTTANLFDATPAAFFGHTRRRAEMNELAAQMFEAERRPDVILGGGARHMLPAGQLGAQRSDNRNLVAEFQAEGYSLVTNATELLALDHTTEKILGLFHSNNMDVYIDKAILRDPEVLRGLDDQPTLWDMTDKAIQALSQNPNGFFLMVEAASVDKQAHPADWHRSVWDMIEFDKAVAVAKEFAANNPDTLIIVTADHAHSLTITGTYWEGDGKTGRDAVRTYADAGFPTYVDSDGDGFPDEIEVERGLVIGWGNHPDYYDDFKLQPRPVSPTIQEGDRMVANPARKGDLMTGNLPYSAGTTVHTADDVPLRAQGPGAEYFSGLLDNTEIFFGIVHALGLEVPIDEK